MYMPYKEALELVKMRIAEDGIGWALATAEYAELVGCSKASALRDVGRVLQSFDPKYIPSK